MKISFSKWYPSKKMEQSPRYRVKPIVCRLSMTGFYCGYPFPLTATGPNALSFLQRLLQLDAQQAPAPPGTALGDQLARRTSAACEVMQRLCASIRACSTRQARLFEELRRGTGLSGWTVCGTELCDAHVDAIRWVGRIRFHGAAASVGDRPVIVWKRARRPSCLVKP